MEVKLENRAVLVLILAFIESSIVFIFNMLVTIKGKQYLESFNYGTWLNIILVIASVFWILAIFTACIGIQKRSRKWLFPFIALLYLSILPLLAGLCVAIGMMFDKRGNIIDIDDWYGRDTRISISWDLLVGIFASVGIGLSIYFVKVLQGYYGALADLTTTEEPVDE